MTSSEIHQLGTVKAPQDCFGRRDAPPQAVIKDDAFWDRYDCDTLIYDTIWDADRKRLRLVMPKPFNFADPLLQGRFCIDDQPVKPRLHKFQRFDLIDFMAERADRLNLTTADTQINIPISSAQPNRFAGRNVIYTMIHNDDLAWVHDWALAHQRNHGADAVLIANNGSTAYTSDALAATLATVPGIAVADVLEVPLPYGPTGGASTALGNAKFLQTACLNLVRDRFFQQARAVLLCDVDELVTGPDGQSIFDATVQSLTKYKPFTGVWRYADAPAPTIRHADHILRHHTKKICASKYCIVPDSFFGRMCWSVHSLENVNRRIFRPRNRFQFYHCRSISTSWKNNRRATTKHGCEPDPATEAFMRRTFPPT
ncbi:hypothetical protein ACJ5NV_14445 [Loktanella agnita]|uniref:hypothetical protein n=1 Tax=Loktanella agnita TaxID=287097 RepID=UPI00398586A5